MDQDLRVQSVMKKIELQSSLLKACHCAISPASVSEQNNMRMDGWTLIKLGGNNQYAGPK